MITKDLLRELFDYRDDGILIRRIAQTNRVKVGDVAGRERKDGYRQISVLGKMRLAHRLIWMWHHGESPPTVDHIDRDPRNNRIENLRAATYSEQLMNRGKMINKSSRYKGVSWSKKFTCWEAHARRDGRKVFLGHFAIEDEAAIAYDKFAACNYGPFGVLNETHP